MISHATFTTSDSTLARYSGVLSDLSLALLAAWIFNLLVVELPRRRDRARLYSGVAWMIGLMAQSGLSMMEHLSHAAKESINIDPQVGGIIMTANREATNRICAAIGPNIPYAPIPGAAGCWELIRNHIQKARDYHRRLEPWLSAFDVEVSAGFRVSAPALMPITVRGRVAVATRIRVAAVVILSGVYDTPEAMSRT